MRLPLDATVSGHLHYTLGGMAPLLSEFRLLARYSRGPFLTCHGILALMYRSRVLHSFQTHHQSRQRSRWILGVPDCQEETSFCFNKTGGGYDFP